nr:ATP-binding cassette domain-containing protein [Peptoniphilus sp. BV3AC2]
MVMQDVNHQLFTESVEEEMKVNLSAKYADGKYIDILKSLNLYHLLEKHPMSLSGGQKQRLAIATAMVSDRDIIFFDEPTSGLDYYHMQEVAKNMLELKKERKTIFIITHDYELIEECCEHILCFDNQSKRIIGNFSDEKITKLYLGEKHGS